MSAAATLPDLGARRATLAAAFRGDLDGFIAVDTANVRWLSGFAGEGHVLYGNTPLWFVLGPDGAGQLVAPACEMAWLAELTDVTAVSAYGRFCFEGEDAAPLAGLRDSRALAAAIGEAVEAVGAGERVGIDDGVPATVLAELGEALKPRRLRPAAPYALRARRVKDAFELDLLRRANEIAEDAIFAAIAYAAPGVTERELLAHVRIAMIQRGARPMLGSVGISERGALVDTVTTERALRPGEVIRFDVGCTVDGYHADLARTAVLAPTSDWASSAYSALLAGERAAIDAAQPGATGSELFDIAVKRTREAGLPDYDRSHCGHGIGLQIYEPPLLAPGGDEPLTAGMTLCVETPLYVLGRAGLQVEDAIVVTADGAERLGRASQELILID